MAKKKSFIKLFEKSGEVGPQPNLLKLIKDKFVQMNWDEFKTLFIECMMSAIITETTIHCVVVNNIIKFAANSVSMLCEHSTKDGNSGMYLMTETIRLCHHYGNATDKTIRWRFCLFLNHLLNYMADGAILAVELCDVAEALLLDRLQDKKPEVRAQAAHGLNRLQIPDDPKCRVVKQFLYHMTCDPSIEVRTAIVKEIGLFNNVIDEMLKRTLLDNSDNVRKEAYNRILTYPFSSLSSKQRQTILEKGLEDKNTSIKTLVKKRLLQNWVEECNDEFVTFLEKLGVENEVICEKTLNTMFEEYYDSQILDCIKKYLNSVFRTIDFDELTIEKIFLWKCVAKYLTIEKKIELARNQGHNDDDYIDVLLPDLIMFSDYVRKYYFTYKSINGDDKEFILTQLLDMVKTFKIDDVGAASLNKLCFDLLLEYQTSVKSIKPITTILNLTFVSGEDLINYVKQILNEFQVRTIDVQPLIDKVGKKEMLEHQIASISKSIEELLDNEPEKKNKIKMSLLSLKKIKKEYEEINVSTEENMLVNMAVKNLLKAFELVFQIQQLPKVSTELSLLTDIIQNIVSGYLECSMVNLRMEAIRSSAPYMLANNAIGAKEHMTTLCGEISKPMTNRHLLFKIMFELLLHYDLETFGLCDNLDSDEEYEDVFSIDNILPLLANCIDYEVIDSSFKSVVVKGFCKLLIFEKVKSINLLSKLLIIFFRRLSNETFNIYNDVMTFFTSYVYYINSSSRTLAMCYVQVLREIEEHNLTEKLDIKLDEVNSTLINLTRGLMFRNEKLVINAHGELAGYIFDYLIDENQPYTNMLVDTLYKLEIDFDSDEELVQKLYPKLMRVIKYMKSLDSTKETQNYVKKIVQKFDPVLQKKSSFIDKSYKRNVDDIKEIVEKEPQVPSSSTQEPDSIVEVSHSDLFSQEQIDIGPTDYDNNSNDKYEDGDDDDEGSEGFTKLEAIKRLSERYKSKGHSVSDSD